METFPINIVILSDNENNCKELAQKISNTKISETNVWHEHRDNLDIYTYIRYPNCKISGAPALGSTDILIIYINDNENQNKKNKSDDIFFYKEFTDYCKKYVNERKSIPYKYLIGGGGDQNKNNLNSQLAKELNLTFIPIEDFFNEKNKNNLQEEMITKAYNDEIILKKVFNKIDVDQNGYIDEKDLIHLSRELKHFLSEEDATEAIKLLSENGKIFYQKFRQWWVMGRQDLISFRKIVIMEYCSNFLKNTKNKLDNYISSILQECEQISYTENNENKNKNLQIKVNSYEGYTPKLYLTSHLVMGKEFVEIAKSFPSYNLASPICLEFSLNLLNDNDGGLVVEFLNNLKIELEKLDEDVNWFFHNLINMHIRHTGNKIILHFKIKGTLFEDTFTNINTGVNGYVNLHLNTKLGIDDFCEKKNTNENNFENFKESLSLFNIEANGEYNFLNQKIFEKFHENICELFGLSFISKQFLKYFLSSPEINFSSLYKKQEFKDILNSIMKELLQINNNKEFEKLKLSLQKNYLDVFTLFYKKYSDSGIKNLLPYIDRNNFSISLILNKYQALFKSNLIIENLNNLTV